MSPGVTKVLYVVVKLNKTLGDILCNQINFIVQLYIYIYDVHKISRLNAPDFKGLVVSWKA